MEKIQIISISLLLSIYLKIQLCFQIINAQESLYPLTPQSPERTITNMKCDESEYQFIYNPKKHKRISCKSLIKEEFLKKEYIAKNEMEKMEVSDSNCLIDIDTIDDFNTFIKGIFQKDRFQ